MLQIKDSDVINGRIDHINIGKAKKIRCNNLKDLIELPLWQDVKEVWCFECPKLIRLPLWPKVKIVSCFDCPKLTELPLWPKIEAVYCSKTNISIIHPWETLISLECAKCNKIEILPDLLNVVEVRCKKCPIKSMGYMPKIEEFEHESITLQDVKENNMNIQMDAFINSNNKLTKGINMKWDNLIKTTIKKYLYSKKASKKASKKKVQKPDKKIKSIIK